MSFREKAVARGFIPERFSFALRTAIGACAALFIAWVIGLEHPQWAAMTVFAAAQPVRNMLIEKSFFRAIGTVAGTLVGMLLIVASQGHPAFLVIGLALWVGACAGIGNVLRGFVSYCTILAGYSAAMVALLETAHPGHLLALGLDRGLTVLVGVATGLLIGLIFTPRAHETELAVRTRRLVAAIFADMAGRAGGRAPPGAAAQQELLGEMAFVDDQIDPHGAGSLASRRSARSLRAVVAAQVSALLWLKADRDATTPNIPLAEALADVAHAIDDPAGGPRAMAALERAKREAGDERGLVGVLERQSLALRGWLGACGTTDAGNATSETAERERLLHPVVLHRDWIGARHAGLRATVVMLLVGLVWLLTSWHDGPYVLLGTSVMISLFSTFENPVLMMGNVLAGQLFGAAAVLACRWLVWPYGASELDLVLLLMPFILSAVLPLSHRRTMLGGTDYAMVLLLLSQPAYPLAGTFAASLAMAGAVVTAPLIALFGYRTMFPTNARRRLDNLIVMMVRELQTIARNPDAAAHRTLWRARLYHRLLRLVRLAQASGEQRMSAADGGLAVYALGAAALSMRERLADPGLPAGVRRALTTALDRMADVAGRPARVAPALARAAGRLDALGSGEGDPLRAAAGALSANLCFFQRAGGR